MRRREFIGFIGGAAAWPAVAWAQQQRLNRIPTIGILVASNREDWAGNALAFERRLAELGWNNGSNVTIESRWADGRSDRFAKIADELVQLKVDIIVTGGTLPVLAAKNATSTIPILFAGVGNPVGAGLVAALAHLEGNVTGVSTQTPEIASKRVQFLREIAPGLSRLAILGNIDSASVVQEMAEARAAATTFGLQTLRLEIHHPDDISPVFAGLKDRADALYVVIDPLVLARRSLINTMAIGARLPTMHGSREFAAAGGLMSYGANLPDSFRRVAEFADKILRGAKPGDIPVEQPTKFELVINLTTAKALGLSAPLTLLAIANEVIE
jgi:putative ABC transport system substrate-binding protein